MNTVGERFKACVKKALPTGIKTSLWFIKIMLPVSFLVMLLNYFNILPYISAFATPFFTLIGLPGDAALVLVTSIFTNIYTVVALISSMDFTIREGTILAMMCLISHSFLIETIVLKRTGSSAFVMIVLRIVMSFVAAIVLNMLMPKMDGQLRTALPAALGFTETLTAWVYSSLLLCLKIFIIISTLMILQRLMEEFGVLRILSKIFSPLMRIFGLPESVSFLWIVGNTIGLAYGSAIMMDYVDSGKLSRQDADLLNYHLAVSHSQIEDPLLFAVIGIPMLWLIIPRMMLAVVVVWLRRLELYFLQLKQVRCTQ
ncbi:MAG: nucleoside recognition protein [Culturomica sp.]|jgi:hypothetical protein|nr:nucleoside recognition protein [Culturomica sp.]